MGQAFDPSSSFSEAPGPANLMIAGEPVPTILIVEDDPDIRAMLATLLDLAGFACVVCDSAEAGLAALRDRPVDLILTDYALPEHTGLWLVKRAEHEGLIEGTPVMIVTAHPNPPGTSTYEVVQKPFDLDDLVDRVKRHVSGNGPGRRSKEPSRLPQGSNGDEGNKGGECPEPVELVLYVSAHSVRSAAALNTIKQVLSRFSASRVKLTICDLSQQPAMGTEHSVTFTPTLVRNSPGPRTYILGHITSPELVLELLSDCELREG